MLLASLCEGYTVEHLISQRKLPLVLTSVTDIAFTSLQLTCAIQNSCKKCENYHIWLSLFCQCMCSFKCKNEDGVANIMQTQKYFTYDEVSASYVYFMLQFNREVDWNVFLLKVYKLKWLLVSLWLTCLTLMWSLTMNTGYYRGSLFWSYQTHIV